MCSTYQVAVRFAILVILCSAAPLIAQRPPDIQLTPGMNRDVVEGVIKMVNRYYVSPQVAKEVEDGLRRRLTGGEYDKITSAFDLIDALDEDLQDISKDKHLKMAYSHEPGSPPADGAEVPAETAADWEEARKAARAHNYGFERVERLAGNVGYVDIRAFTRPAFSGNTAAAAMTFLANTDALIIDLRNSRGGSPHMVVFLASYFFPSEEPVHLGDWYCRAEARAGETSSEQSWTLPYVPGTNQGDKDLYILMSRRTFSAPEGLAALLQHHKRATVVGERSIGGTHAGNMIRVHPNFAVFVPMCWPIFPAGTPAYPMGRPVYPSTKTDYQGTGVTPDIEVPADDALKAAHLQALQKRLEKFPDEKMRLQPIIDGLRKELKR